jgi:two-component system CheB/CheR fusion protein
MVDGDPNRLQQVVANLLGNAAKYTPAGGVIDLKLYRDDESAVVRVRDNGIGMTDQDLRCVFDPFTQAGGIGADTEGGLGLGLTLVRRLVELHGGAARADSEGPGRGSEFTVRLPLTSERVTAVESAHDPKPTAQKHPARALKILIVDDNSAAADMLTALLEIEGHTTIAAYNGQSALDMVEQTRPDVILLDLRMPEMDGFEVAKRLRSTLLEAQTLLVAMSGLGRDTDVARAKQAGFDHYLVKPVDPSKLHRLLAEISEGRKQQGALKSSRQ